MMLAFFAFGVVVVFLAALRLGLLDDLPALFGRRPTPPDPEEARRLEVFRQYMDADSEADEQD